MGLAIQPIAARKATMGPGRVDYQRIGIRWLRELARQDHPEHTDEATRVFVTRALDMEVERRMELVHENLGWHNHSLAAPGIGVGGTDIAREPLAHICDRWRGTHEVHEFVRCWIALARLPERQLLAVLIQAAKTDRRVRGPFGKSYDAIAEDIGTCAQILGWSPVSPIVPEKRRWCDWPPVEKPRRCVQEEREPLFANGEALRQAAKRARVALTLLARA